MKLFVYLAMVVTLLGCSKPPHEELLGYWKSNESRTLESMRKTPGIPMETREFFENNFFGKLVVEYKVDTVRSKYELDKDNIEEFYKYYPYKVLEKGKNYYLLESHSYISDENDINKIHMEGNCYYALVTKYDFREYFCRIEK